VILKENLKESMHVFLDDLMKKVDHMDYHKLNNPGTQDLEEVLLQWIKFRKIEIRDIEND
jgi:hypothetical protein